jgi:shikimate kinase
MFRSAEAESHGAVTIVNAMATGSGAAIGINLWTKAAVTVTNQPGAFLARNLSDPNESTGLAEMTAKLVFTYFGAIRRLGAVIETESNIPTAVGLKSSSAASNAVALASLHALDKNLGDLQTVRLGVEASLRARVTLTGAYDDACACYFGGLVVTDNFRRKIVKRFKPRGRPRVLIHVPNTKKYTRDIDPRSLRVMRPFVQAAYREAVRGNYWKAMTLNGLAYSMALGYDTTAATTALNAGAIAAGLTGKGPAVAAIVTESKKENVRSAWRRMKGKVIDASLNSRKAGAWGLPR